MIPLGERRAFDSFASGSSDRLLRTARRWRTAREQPEAYARRVVVNLTKDRWRQLSRRPHESPIRTDVRMPESDGILDRDELLRATRQLAHGQRAVLVLRYFDDLSVEETAAALGCTTGTVKSQTSRALENLRAALIPQKENADVDQ